MEAAGRAQPSVFRFQGGEWIFNLGTKALDSGVYSLTIEKSDGRRLVGGIVLR